MSTVATNDNTPGFEAFMRDHGREGIAAGLAIEELMEGAYQAGVKAAREQQGKAHATLSFDPGQENELLAALADSTVFGTGRVIVKRLSPFEVIKTQPGEPLGLPGFTAGETYERGDCSNWVAGIDHFDGCQGVWMHRIEVYGKSDADAIALRDKVLRIITTPPGQLLDKSKQRGGHFYQGWNAYRKEQAQRLGIEE